MNRVIFAFLVIAVSSIPAFAKYSGGTGDPNTPYQIANVADLNTMASNTGDYNKCFIMTADIDLDPNIPGNKVFNTAVIAPDTSSTDDFQGTPFTGIFDGAGHKILNLNINGSGNDYLGLFGQVSGGYIKTLCVQNVYIARNTPYAYAHGGIIGANNGNLSNCYSTGNIYGGYFLNSYGGLVGQNDSNGFIINCFSAANVTVDGWEGVFAMGGLVGANYGNITNSYSVGSVPLSGYGFIGYNTGTVIASFWDVNTSGKSISAGGTGKTTAQMQILSTFTDAGWDFNDIWRICENLSYPRLRWSLPAADFVCPNGVNFIDYSFFANRWMNTNCAANNNCNGTDFDSSGTVDLADLVSFAGNWLQGL
jgi:hypothetical protein